MGTALEGLDRARLRAIAASGRPLAPHECAERARLAAGLIELGGLDRSGPGEAMLLWRDDHSEAWLNLWWQPRDTGYHDHSGSCVGVHVLEGRAWNEPLTIGEPPETSEYGPGESFWFPGEGIHRMDHQAGAVTIHVYSPPIQAIGHYDLHDGQLRRTRFLPDQPSPPSTALYQALHPLAGTGRASRDLANLCRCVARPCSCHRSPEPEISYLPDSRVRAGDRRNTHATGERVYGDSSPIVTSADGSTSKFAQQADFINRLTWGEYPLPPRIG